MKTTRNSVQPKWYQGLGSLSFAVLVALTLRWGVAEAYVIPSGSMLPTLQIHDHIFVNKFVYGIRAPFSKAWLAKFREPKRGEVIVFKSPKEEGIFLVKRVIALPEDEVSYHDNKLTINGSVIETTKAGSSPDFDWVRDQELENQKSEHEDLIENIPDHPHSVLHVRGTNDREFGPLKIPENSLFVMGDHRDNSSDSRYWGFVPKENILGRAMFVWLSCEEELPGVNVGCDPRTVRWGRFFHPVN